MKGMNTSGKISVVGVLYDIVIADRLQDGFECMIHRGKIYLRKDRSVESKVASVLGFLSRQYREWVLGRTLKYTDMAEGLRIGERQVRVQIVESGTEPEEWLLDLDENSLLILGDRHLFTVIDRAAKAANETFSEWQRRSIKRAFCREKPRFDAGLPAVIEEVPAATRRRKRAAKVRPGELLPPEERSALTEGDEAIRRIMGESSEAA